METSNQQRVHIGPAADLPEGRGCVVTIGKRQYAVFRSQGKLGCLNNSCLHSGGPLGEGTVKDGKVICPWHNWDFDMQTGKGWGDESVGGYKIWEEDGEVYVDISKMEYPKKIAPAHDTIRIEPSKRTDDKIRILGISTTNMEPGHPRNSTSEFVLEESLKQFGDATQFETRVLKLRDLKIAECQGFYSKDKGACVWPCSITQAKKDDEMVQVYRGLVEWCDIVVVATPIRWGCASSLYYKMQERLNALQNQITLHNRVLIKEKAACFIVTGGQDGVQAVSAQMMMFFAELGFTFPQFPFIGWTRGWYNEEMKTNFADVAQSDLAAESGKMIGRGVDLINAYRAGDQPIAHTHKAHK
jgi:nitrite reductase/ring-hydroxylating ferredoxin subunit/multimeric flavodoxin WrbA